MRRVDRLPLLATMHAKPRAIPKPSTRLTRAYANKARRLKDARELRAWALAVKHRDHYRDRRTGVQVSSTRQLDPLRAEAHHIVSRDDKAVRYDVRNGLCLSFATHVAITTHQLRIEGTKFFSVRGSRYIDATFAVTFVRL